jgi:hypothetical protein
MLYRLSYTLVLLFFPWFNPHLGSRRGDEVDTLPDMAKSVKGLSHPFSKPFWLSMSKPLS